MTEQGEARSDDVDPDVDEFTAAQEGDYEPGIDEAEVLADEHERPIDDAGADDGFPDDERVVVFDDEPGTDET